MEIDALLRPVDTLGNLATNALRHVGLDKWAEHREIQAAERKAQVLATRQCAEQILAQYINFRPESGAWNSQLNAWSFDVLEQNKVVIAAITQILSEASSHPTTRVDITKPEAYQLDLQTKRGFRGKAEHHRAIEGVTATLSRQVDRSLIGSIYIGTLHENRQPALRQYVMLAHAHMHPINQPLA